MDIGIVGLGRMGLNIALRLLRGGHRVVVHNRSPEPVAVATEAGAEAADSIAAMADALDGPRVVWLMLPAGAVTDTHVDEALAALSDGDVIVEGSNGRWQDALAQAERARATGVHVVDVGVSGGVWGLENGFSLMAGGDAEAVALVKPGREDSLDQLDPVDAGQRQIHDRHVERSVEDVRKGRLRRGSLAADHKVGLKPNQAGVALPHDGVIFDEVDGVRHG